MLAPRGGRAAAAAVTAVALPLALLAACGTAAAPGTAAQQAKASPVAQAKPATPAKAATRAKATTPAKAAAEAVSSGAAGPAQATSSVQAARLAAGTTVPGAPGCPMFPADNVWNTDISKLPVNPRSAAWMKSMDSAHTFLHPDFGPHPGGYPYGMPFNIVTNAHPLVRIKFRYAADSNKGRYPFGASTRIEGGRKAGGDRHAIMVNSGTCRLSELFDARYSARPTAGSGAIWNLRSNRLRTSGHTSADAAGLPILPGLLSYRQVRAAVRTHTPIRHAIRFTAGRTRTHFIWPARHEAGSSASRRLPPMGARFRLNASFDVPAFCHSTRYCRAAKAVLREMQHYGLILADNGSNWFFGGSAFPRWPDGLVSLLKGIPASAFEAVDESCLRVSRNSGKATAKPGCPIG